MSIKTNTISLQSLLEQVNALPEAENLDAEISTQTTLLSEQDAKIAELAQVLADKTSGSTSSIEVCNVQVGFTSYDIYATVYDETTGEVSNKLCRGNNNPCIKGSFIHVRLPNNSSYNIQLTNLTLIRRDDYGVIIEVPKNAENTATIDCWFD